MAGKRITDMTAAATLTGDELIEVSQLSATVEITATTISAQNSDNSYNDSGSGFVAAGFAVGNRVHVSGFTGNVANNIFVGVITALTTGKMTIGGADGNVIVDDAAGESVTITKWESHRATAQDIADLGSGGGGGSALEIEDEGVSVDAAVVKIDFIGSGVTATQTAAGEVEVDIPGGGGGGGVVGLPSIITGFSSSATDLFHGSRFLPFVNMDIDGIAYGAQRAASGVQQFRFHVVTLSNLSGAGNIGTVLASSATVTLGGPGSLPTGGVEPIGPLSLVAGTQYGIVAERIAADPNRTGICAANVFLGGVAGMLLTGFASTSAFAAAAAFLNSSTPFTLGVRTAA